MATRFFLLFNPRKNTPLVSLRSIILPAWQFTLLSRDQPIEITSVSQWLGYARHSVPPPPHAHSIKPLLVFSPPFRGQIDIFGRFPHRSRRRASGAVRSVAVAVTRAPTRRRRGRRERGRFSRKGPGTSPQQHHAERAPPGSGARELATVSPAARDRRQRPRLRQ